MKPLPCPFCGHEADASRIGLTNRYGVTCGQPEGCIVEAQATGRSMEEAIRLWNTRPTNVIPFPVIGVSVTYDELASIPGGLL